MLSLCTSLCTRREEKQLTKDENFHDVTDPKLDNSPLCEVWSSDDGPDLNMCLSRTYDVDIKYKVLNQREFLKIRC